MTSTVVIAWSLALFALAQGSGGAGPEETFRSAVEDFQFGDHAEAAAKLRAVLEPPILKRREDLVAGRQYLGACYYLLGDKTKAKSEFSMLLAIEPTHVLDP